ncbi:nucleotidyltransferase domain-containing protein [Thermoproteus tenax]|uniref:Minimal nucleotidyltransferase family protein n=1 Tax=Thermoproteus tenax (strain ATCC 35583 / DSM 2078 / JCM 9277 / NBRC 100435 / Kra 1) TaxID=768679 RepID=G4RJV7_THETK|nr:nucleotidyltransferase domain-containing protein [Thermoproteus tenax]CCC81852.1 minimal nucleotidyltransferase family protein [Thermoproteus tenax Kra 1]
MFIELLADLKRERDRYVAETWRYLSAIKEAVWRVDPDAWVLAFGSFVRGDFRPDSDVDVLVVTTADKFAVYRAAADAVGRGPHPFEIHVAIPQEYESWYRRFIDAWQEV